MACKKLVMNVLQEIENPNFLQNEGRNCGAEKGLSEGLIDKRLRGIISAKILQMNGKQGVQ